MAFQNFYGKQLTVLVVTLLLVFSSFTFLPALAYKGGAVTGAANISPNTTQVPPTISGSQNVVVASTPTPFSVTVANPSSNPYAIMSLTVQSPSSSWTFSSPPAACDSAAGAALGSVGAASSTAVQCVAAGAGLQPGFSETLSLGDLAGPASPATSSPPSVSLKTLVVDSSSPASYQGETFVVYSITSTTVTVTLSPTSTNFVAGSSPYTVTAQLTSLQPGVPIVFSEANAGANGEVVTPSTAVFSDSNGMATASFAPSNTAGITDSAIATVGVNSGISGSSATVTTVAAAPSEISILTSTTVSGSSTHYLGTQGTTTNTNTAGTFTGAESAIGDITYKFADRYGNGIDFATLTNTKITITALSGGGIFDTTNLPNIVQCGVTSPQFTCPASGISQSLPFNYFQNGAYQTIGQVSITLTGTYNSAPISVSGTSGQLVTTTFTASSPTPDVAILGTNCGTAGSPVAGCSVNVSATLSTVQQNVPVQLYVCNSTDNVGCTISSKYTGSFSNALQTIAGVTTASGTFSAAFAVDTLAGQQVQFVAAVTAPTDTTPTQVLANSSLSAVQTTQAGAAAQLVVLTAYDKVGTYLITNGQSVPSATIYVDVALADAYGNRVLNTASNQIQVNLVPASGVLSATTVYIAQGTPDTFSSFGSIAWTLPSSVGINDTLTASAVFAGKSTSTVYTITTVSATPILGVSSPKPVNGIVYSKTGAIVLSGTANVSAGYQATGGASNGEVDIASLSYKVGSSAWSSVPVAAANQVVWSAALLLPSGMSTITLNTTDSAGNTAVQTVQVLVDNAAPTFGNLTVCDCQTAAAVTVNDSSGDLNASSVQAWVNGTAVPASSVSVSGTNNPGSSVSYTVTIDGLTTGAWSVKISASDLAGNTASTTQTLVIKVPPGSTFTLTSAPGMISKYHVANVNVTSHDTTTDTVVVFAVVTNNLGQTVQISTSTVTVAAGATVSAYPVINVPSGTYTVTLFVWSTSGESLSQTGTMTVTY